MNKFVFILFIIVALTAQSQSKTRILFILDASNEDPENEDITAAVASVVVVPNLIELQS